MNPILNRATTPAGTGYFEVNTNEGLSVLLGALVELVRQATNTPFSNGGQKLTMPMDPQVDDDDPLARLERDSGIEGDIATATRTIRASTISTDDAYAWMRICTLARSIMAAEFGVHTSEDLDDLGEYENSMLELSNFLSWNLAIALDPEIDPELHPELYEGLEGA
jgi:hypothetical protein